MTTIFYNYIKQFVVSRGRRQRWIFLDANFRFKTLYNMKERT